MQHHQISIAQLLIQVNNMCIFINLIKNIHVEKSAIKPIKDTFFMEKVFHNDANNTHDTTIEQYNHHGNKQKIQNVKNNQLTSLLPLSLLYSPVSFYFFVAQHSRKHN